MSSMKSLASILCQRGLASGGDGVPTDGSPIALGLGDVATENQASGALRRQSGLLLRNLN